MTSFNSKLAKALNLVESDQVPTQASFTDPGYDIALQADGDQMVDGRGRPAICCWEALECTDAGEEYPGDRKLTTFADILQYCQKAILDLRANSLHGFKIMPCADQDMYDFDRGWSGMSKGAPYHDIGHTVDLKQSPHGFMVDQNGSNAVWHWDITVVKPDGTAEFGGDINHFDEIESSIVDILDAMKSNACHGFMIMPSEDQY